MFKKLKKPNCFKNLKKREKPGNLKTTGRRGDGGTIRVLDLLTGEEYCTVGTGMGRKRVF